MNAIGQKRVGNRPGRIEPRQKKRRPKPYPLMKKPRAAARRDVILHGHENKLAAKVSAIRPGGGFQLNKYKYYDGPVPDDYVLQQGDIIVTMTDLSKKSDTLGYPAIVPSSAEYRFLHNQRVGLVSEVEECGIGMYVYHVLKSEYCRHTVLGSATGTTVVHTSPKKILAHQTAYSGSGIEAFFDGLVKPYFNRIQELSVESNVLEKLRDTLLPKLLSGQLTIPDAKKLVAGAL